MFPIGLCVLQPQVCQKRLRSGSRVAFTLDFTKYSRSMNPANTGWRMSARSQGEVVAPGSALEFARSGRAFHTEKA